MHTVGLAVFLVVVVMEILFPSQFHWDKEGPYFASFILWARWLRQTLIVSALRLLAPRRDDGALMGASQPRARPKESPHQE